MMKWKVTEDTPIYLYCLAAAILSTYSWMLVPLVFISFGTGVSMCIKQAFDLPEWVVRKSWYCWTMKSTEKWIEKHGRCKKTN